MRLRFTHPIHCPIGGTMALVKLKNTHDLYRVGAVKAFHHIKKLTPVFEEWSLNVRKRAI